jgi:hypothetical protein
MIRTWKPAISLRYVRRTTVVEGKPLNKTYQRRHLSKCKKDDPRQTLMVSMSNMMIKVATEPPAKRGGLACLYKRHQVLQLPWTPFQRKTPETMSASRTRSLINVEVIDILVFKTSSNTQPISVQCPRDVVATDKKFRRPSAR